MTDRHVAAIDDLLNLYRDPSGQVSEPWNLHIGWMEAGKMGTWPGDRERVPNQKKIGCGVRLFDCRIAWAVLETSS